MRVTLVRTRPPLQLCMPAARWCDQSPCIREKASWMCSGCIAIRASSGGKNSELTGSVYSSRSLLCFSAEPPKDVVVRLPMTGDVYSSSREASSSDFLTERPAKVRERTISKARKPTISTVSSFAFRSRCGGRLRNSRKRLTGESINHRRRCGEIGMPAFATCK